MRFGDPAAGDAARMVSVTGDDRDELVRRALASPDPTDRDAVRHATALFRDRTATRETKRSAVAALARILENRRGLLKAELLRGDEGAGDRTGTQNPAYSPARPPHHRAR